MKYLITPILFIIFFTQNGCASDTGQSHLNIDDANLALQGYDPVSYHSGTVKKGLRQFSLSYEAAVYHFANGENLARFQKQPTRFLPAFGGWCAWAMLDGEKVPIDPKTYKIIDGTTYLYYNFLFTNTLSKWNRLAEQQGENKLIKRGLDAWKVVNQ